MTTPAIQAERKALAAQGLEIAWRSTWGAVEDYDSERPVQQAEYLFLHIAVVDDPSDLVGDEHTVMRNIERIGQLRFGVGCSYNAAAFDTGRLYEAQPLTRRGAHTVNDLPNPQFRVGSLNHLARALVLPQQVTHRVTDVQIHSAAKWGAAVCRTGYAVPGAEWFGHRDVTRKACPGEIAYARLEELNRLTRQYEVHGLMPAHESSEDDDMFSYEFTKDGVTHLRIVDGGKQTAFTGQHYLEQRRGKPNHLENVQPDEVQRLNERYGPA